MATVRVAGGARAALAERGCLLIADIAGYTDYVVSSPLEHAEDVVADATAIVAGRLATVLTLNKLEGDAVFAYAREGALDGTMLLDAVEECYFAFRNRLAGMQHATSCDCNACAKLPDLDLKFVAHYGEFVRRAGAGGDELTGADVILVHRLLKNRVAEATGVRGYLLVSEACADALRLDATALGLVEHVEEYDDVGAVRAFAADLEARYLSELERRHELVGRHEADFEVETTLPASPPVAWEYLTAPAKRALWQGRVEFDAAAGRRGPGTTAYCVDGRASVYEEILDWRPFRYFTERLSLPGGARIVVSTELLEEGDGTRVRVRGRAPGPRRERLAWFVNRPRHLRRLRRSHERLATLFGDAE
jgi:uncharacterized protein YndB with AHSA1/START domain